MDASVWFFFFSVRIRIDSMWAIQQYTQGMSGWQVVDIHCDVVFHSHKTGPSEETVLVALLLVNVKDLHRLL